MIAWTAEPMRRHDPGPHHPEQPARLDAARRGLEGLVTWREPVPVDVDLVGQVHDPGYVALVMGLRGRRVSLDPDTHLMEDSVEAAMLAAGAAVQMTEALLDGEDEVGWALVRPPGHHAEAGRAMGFCVLNNVAVAARAALNRGVERVAVVDWDVHHGNGTQHLFQARNDVLFYSSHHYGGGFYPGTGALTETGEGAGEGFTVNAPLRTGAGDPAITAALRDRFERICRDFQPQLVLVSAGFDAHRDDPLGGLAVSDAGFRELGLRVRELADQAGAPLGLVLEGGYDLGALERSVRAVGTAIGSGSTPEAGRGAG